MHEGTMRIIVAALALTALSFFAGVAGDLSAPPANAGQTVTLRLPPPIPADAPRAGPLVSTSTAMAAPPRHVIRAEPAVTVESPRPEAKPLAQHRMLVRLPKVEETTFAKAKERKQA